MSSKFCGKVVCKTHSKKQRYDPQDETSPVRICDTCERKYLNHQLNLRFQAKKQKIEAKMKVYSQQLRNQRKNHQEKEHEIGQLRQYVSEQI